MISENQSNVSNELVEKKLFDTENNQKCVNTLNKGDVEEVPEVSTTTTSCISIQSTHAYY